MVIGNTQEYIASSEEGEFNYPLGVAVDTNTDNIYVVDQLNNRVQLFNNKGEYLLMFGDRDEADIPNLRNGTERNGTVP